MALRHHSLQMSEVGEVTDLLWGFERENKVFLNVVMETVLVRGKVDLEITIHCYDNPPEDTEAMHSLLASATCFSMNLKTIRDAVTRVLYMLDGQLAQRAFDTLERE